MAYNYIKAAIRCPLQMLSCGIALGLTVTIPANASQVGGWWNGSWNCNIDGRAAQMKWSVVDDSQTSCNGDVCSTAASVRWAGQFSDSGSRWVALNNARSGNNGGLFFNHADGNRWYLAKPVSNKASGWTTWNGKRYPLSCWR
jgi:Family of unknown function (DUF6006)